MSDVRDVRDASNGSGASEPTGPAPVPPRVIVARARASIDFLQEHSAEPMPPGVIQRVAHTLSVLADAFDAQVRETATARDEARAARMNAAQAESALGETHRALAVAKNALERVRPQARGVLVLQDIDGALHMIGTVCQGVSGV